MNNNTNNFQGFETNQFSKLMNFKTELKYKYLMITLMTIIPFLVFILTLGNGSGYSDGLIWGLSMAVFFIDTVIVYLLTRFARPINNDMYPAIFAHCWFWIAWYGLYMIGWWRILVSIIFYIVFYVIGLFVAIILTLYQQKKKFDGMLKDLTGATGANSEMYEDILNNQTTTNVFTNMQGNESILKNLDEELRRQGIDIDKLDEQFGTFLDKDDQLKAKQKQKDLSGFTSEEEIIEALSKEESVEEIITSNKVVDETEDDLDNKKIIDQ